ncbi:MAG: GDYXXLXY domain-containing protein [Vicinamibacteria bacterium]|nr:GDYXXLXY domain-containing protein [Vicinamibacteria bacterium]
MRGVLLLAVFQVGVILGWAGFEENVRRHAPVFRVPLQPVDPHDLLRGRYFRLNPTDSNLKTGTPGVALGAAEVERFLAGDKAYMGLVEVGFCPEAKLQRVCALARVDPTAATGRPEAAFWSRGHAFIDWEAEVWRDGERVPEPGWRVRLELGVERFFLPQRLELPAQESAPGWSLELAHRPGRAPLPLRLYFEDRLVFES